MRPAIRARIEEQSLKDPKARAGRDSWRYSKTAHIGDASHSLCNSFANILFARIGSAALRDGRRGVMAAGKRDSE